MIVYGVIRNMKGRSDVQNSVYEIVTGKIENEIQDLSVNSTNASKVLLQSPSTPCLQTSTIPTQELTFDQRGFQYYIIGIYAFFAAIFTIGIIIVIARKVQRACCSRPKTHRIEYDSVPNIENYHPQDNTNSVNSVNVDYLDVGRPNQGYDSDYDNYSDTANEQPDIGKDKPPEYEEPPSYSVVLQT